MQESIYKTYDELPLFLNAKMVAQLLGVSPSSAYELMHKKGFPGLRIGNRLVVPKAEFQSWVKEHHYPSRDPIRNYFPLPNEIFQLGLTPGELAVYSFLLQCENRETYQCYPSYRTIGEAVGLSRNAVKTKVDSLVEKQLIYTEPTTIKLKDGRTRNGNLLYTIRPLDAAKQHYIEQQAKENEKKKALQEWLEKLERMQNGEPDPVEPL